MFNYISKPMLPKTFHWKYQEMNGVDTGGQSVGLAEKVSDDVCVQYLPSINKAM